MGCREAAAPCTLSSAEWKRRTTRTTEESFLRGALASGELLADPDSLNDPRCASRREAACCGEDTESEERRRSEAPATDDRRRCDCAFPAAPGAVGDSGCLRGDLRGDSRSPLVPVDPGQWLSAGGAATAEGVRAKTLERLERPGDLGDLGDLGRLGVVAA
mmetsp:Transcript_52479/g.106996  ORF Transcript_52479/g.106996 Transcript_52479/m.106996 type:complete len:161 (+) Transcript_52479:443-925(+)